MPQVPLGAQDCANMNNHTNNNFTVKANLFTRTAFFIKRSIRNNSFVYFSLMGSRNEVRKLRARPNYDLVIEGFPRSANTTTVYALQYAHIEQPIKIGHHLHVGAHIRFAVKHGIPCGVVIRKPLDCVASRIAMKGTQIYAAELFRDYISFLEVVEELRSHVVVYSFEDIVSGGVGPFVRDLNKRYNINLNVPPDDDAQRSWVRRKVLDWNVKFKDGDENKLSIPSSQKAETISTIKNCLKKECAEELGLAELIYRSNFMSNG